MLATTSLGAVWTACAPDFGTRSVLDRFAQVAPTVLVAVDGYRFGGRVYDRRAVVGELRQGLPTVRATLVIRSVWPSGSGRYLRSPRVVRPRGGRLPLRSRSSA